MIGATCLLRISIRTTLRIRLATFPRTRHEISWRRYRRNSTRRGQPSQLLADRSWSSPFQSTSPTRAAPPLACTPFPGFDSRPQSGRERAACRGANDATGRCPRGMTLTRRTVHLGLSRPAARAAKAAKPKGKANHATITSTGGTGRVLSRTVINTY